MGMSQHVVQWSNRQTGLVVVIAATVCAARLLRQSTGDGTGARRTRVRAAAASRERDWRAEWPDVATAMRAGTWGDGGRDY